MPTSSWWMPVYWQGSMPHTPTVRSFDKHFLHCGRKTKRRREARELCRGLSSSRLEWEMCVLSVALIDNSAMKVHTHTHILTHSQIEKERGRKEGRIYSHLSRRFCWVKVVPGTLLITQAVLFYSRDTQLPTPQTVILSQINTCLIYFSICEWGEASLNQI